MSLTRLRDKRYGSCAAQCEREPRKHHEVSVKLYARQTADTEQF